MLPATALGMSTLPCLLVFFLLDSLFYAMQLSYVQIFVDWRDCWPSYYTQALRSA